MIIKQTTYVFINSTVTSTVTTETLTTFVSLNRKITFGLYASFDGATKKMLMTAKLLFLKVQISFLVFKKTFFQTVVTHFCVWKNNVLSGSSVFLIYMSWRIEKLDDIPKFLFRSGNSGVIHDKKVPGLRALLNTEDNTNITSESSQIHN